jgi:dihydrofolate reductase
MRRLNLIVSCSENRVIGRGGKLPWSIPEDWKFFQEQTAGQIVVMGHVCFESWPGASRDGRRAVVVTSSSAPTGPGVRFAPSLAGALAIAESLPGDIYICGGQRIYEESIALPGPQRLYLTQVHAEVPGDRFFPDWKSLPWRETARRDGANANWRYTFLTLER